MNTEMTQAEMAEMQAAQDAYESEMWNDEQAQTIFAERGGYSAGLSRPASRFDRAADAARVCENEDIAF